jgi:hypothetical protein
LKGYIVRNDKKLQPPISKECSLFQPAIKGMAGLLAVLFLSIAAGESALACECNFVSEREKFKHAKRVFIGEVQAIDNNAMIEDPEYYRYNVIVTFKIIKAWKGKKSGIVRARFSPELSLGCDGRTPVLSSKYLVYALGKYLIIDTGCSHTRLLDMQEERMQAQIRKLNSFWFRFRARVIPF